MRQHGHRHARAGLARVVGPQALRNAHAGGGHGVHALVAARQAVGGDLKQRQAAPVVRRVQPEVAGGGGGGQKSSLR